MKRYPQLSNTARTRILCQLFLEKISVLLEFTAQQTAVFLANPALFELQHDALF